MFGNNKIDKKISKDIDKENKRRLEEVVPIAYEVIKIIAEAKLSIGDTHARDNTQYTAVSKNVLRLLLEKNLKYSDRVFLFQLVFQPFDQIGSIVKKSLEESFGVALDEVFGKAFMDVRLDDLEEVLTQEKAEKH